LKQLTADIGLMAEIYKPEKIDRYKAMLLIWACRLEQDECLQRFTYEIDEWRRLGKLTVWERFVFLTDFVLVTW